MCTCHAHVEYSIDYWRRVLRRDEILMSKTENSIDCLASLWSLYLL